MPTSRPLIAHVSFARGYRGGERQVQRLVSGLAALGFPQRVVIGGRSGLGERLQRDGGLDIRCVAHPVTAVAALRGSDVVHAHEGRAVYAAWLFHCITRVPYVLTRRVLGRPSANPFARRAYRDAAMRIGVCEAVSDELREYAGEPVATVPSALIPPAVRPDHVASLRQAWRGRRAVGCVAALTREKGHSVLIGAARRLRETFPELLFVLLGAGPQESALRRQAAGLDNVCFAGFHDDVGSYLAAFDIFVLPSLAEAGAGALLEAMDRGLPVVASRVGGIPELVSDGESGLLVPPGDPESLAAAICRLLRDPDLAAALARKARESSASRSDLSMVARYASIYERVVQAVPA